MGSSADGSCVKTGSPRSDEGGMLGIPMDIVAGIVVVIASVLGVALTVLTLPGIWLAIAVAVGCELWRGEMFSPWTLGAAVLVGVVAEVLELVASAFGAAKAGGTRRGAIGSLVGALVGAILGTPVFPVLGTILGGAIGAGLGAMIAERHNDRKTWREASRIGTGAAIGRLTATIVKSGLSIVVALILIVGAFV